MSLQWLDYLDWLTPLLSLLNRNVENIGLDSDERWAADELKRKGVRVRRIIFAPGDRITFDVPVNQVSLSIMLLRQMGIQVEDGKGRPWHRKKRKKSRRK